MSLSVDLNISQQTAERIKNTFELGKITDFEDNTKEISNISNGLLEEDEIYILSSWNSNTHFKYVGLNRIEVINHYGDSLEEGKEYMIIYPKY
jgi:hypothetical protein